MSAETIIILAICIFAVYYVWKIIRSFIKGLTEEDILLFTTSEIGKPYKTIKMIEGTGKTENIAKENITETARKLNADAIVGFSSNIESTTSGSVGSSLGGGVYGKTNTTHKYYFVGTAVKFIKTNSIQSLSQYEDIASEDIKKLKSLLADSIINEDEFQDRKSKIIEKLNKQKNKGK